MKTASHVNAPMSYLKVEDQQEKPTYYLCTPPPGVPQRNTTQVKHTMAIQNAREHIDDISLDKQGITFTQHETAVENFYDAEEVKAVYYPEVVELIKKMTGAEKVHVFDHNVRCARCVPVARTAPASRSSLPTTIIPSSPVRSGCAICCRPKKPKNGCNIALP